MKVKTFTFSTLDPILKQVSHVLHGGNEKFPKDKAPIAIRPKIDSGLITQNLKHLIGLTVMAYGTLKMPDWVWNKTLYQIHLAYLSFGPFKKILTPNKQLAITPQEHFANFHTAGITGKNVTIGIIDQEIEQTAHLKTLKQNGKLKRCRTPETEKDHTKILARVGHGTRVSEMIHQACPESSLVCTEVQKLDIDVMKFLKQYLDTPTALTLEVFRRKILSPFIKNIALDVINTIDNGAEVINISLGPEQIIHRLFSSASKLGGILETGSMSEGIESWLVKLLIPEEKDRKKIKHLTEHMSYLFGQYLDPKNTNQMQQNITKDYTPWIDALNYAKQNNVTVVVSAGNQGGHQVLDNNIVGLGNMFGIQDHPALIMVGSTNGLGKVSTFSSEFGNTRTPSIAANGETMILKIQRASIITQIRQHPIIYTILSPFLLPGILSLKQRITLKDRYAKGTSFSAPVITATIGLIQSYAKTELGISLPSNMIKVILQSSADPVSFSTKDLRETILPEILTRLIEKKTISLIDIENNTITPDQIAQIHKEIAEELKRRTGAGEANPAKILWLTQQAIKQAK